MDIPCVYQPIKKTTLTIFIIGIGDYGLMGRKLHLRKE